MKLFACGLALALVAPTVAYAGGWRTLHKHVHSSGRCAGHAVLATYYSLGRRTASGEAFHADGNTVLAAGHGVERQQPQNRPLGLRSHKRSRTLGLGLCHGRPARPRTRRRASARHAR